MKLLGSRILFLGLIGLLPLLLTTNGANILGVFPLHVKSHFQMFEAFMEGLAAKGHNVVVMSHFPHKISIPRLRDISLAGTLPMVVNNMSIAVLGKRDIWKTVSDLTNRIGSSICDVLLKFPETDKVYEDLKNKKYDVLITEIFATDCALALAGDNGVPTVAMVSSFNLPWLNDRFGGVDNPAYLLNHYVTFATPMNFFQRVYNTYAQVLCKVLYYYKSTLVADHQIREKFGTNIPSLETLQKNTSLVLVNSHFSLSESRPLPPNIKEVAGLHLETPGILPEKFENIMNGAKQGVILFTLGSMIRTETFEIEKKRALLDAFAEFPEYVVIWKGDRASFPEPIPKNIHFENWLPQYQILCHPKTKVFLTHGGLLGSLEAVNCGVPLIGFPLFGDQFFNIANFERKGFATSLNIHTFTKQDVLIALKAVLGETRYMNTAKQVSKAFKDRPLTAMEEAIYWVEYVIRHKGASHLKPGSADLAWYQLYLFDIALFVIILVVSIFTVIYLLISSLYKKFCSKKNVKKIKTK